MVIHEGPLRTDLTDSEFSTEKRQGVIRMMHWLRSIRLLPLWRVSFLWLALAPAASAVVVVDWVTVGDPGNACDPQSQGCFGAVAESYRISRFEVTNAQYAEFLNAVATTDANGLYHVNMGSVEVADFGGITQIGVPGSFSYSVIVGRENMPVIWISFWDAVRFANWLHNGQPTGAQDITTTEDGAYTLTPTAISNNTVMRNPGAQVFITSEDEWYKAAYYDAGTMSYFDYPAGSDTPTTCAPPGATANTANCNYLAIPDLRDLTNTGSHTGSASPAGTFDQGGNAWEWSDTILSANRIIRGGSVFFDATQLHAGTQLNTFPEDLGHTGIRVASRFSPDVGLLDAKVTAGAEVVLQNAGGTVRLEQPKVDWYGDATFYVPEPVALWQLHSGVALLALLYARRRRV